MNILRILDLRLAWVLISTLSFSATSFAASSLSDSLTGFSGDSTAPATQTAVGTAGLDFFSTEGLNDDFTADPTVAFSISGATFGSLFAGDGGRNYMRTVASDYSAVDFVAEITFERNSGVDPDAQQVFFGMGAGDTALFGVPDWSTQFSSTFVTTDPDSLTNFKTSNDVNLFTGSTDVVSAGVGIHRLQMTYNSAARTMDYAIDLDFAGGAFTADATTDTLDLNSVACADMSCGGGATADLYGVDGWPNEPSRIYFGGDDGVILSDLAVTVSASPGLTGDFDGDDDVDGQDFLLWQRGPASASDLMNWQQHYGEVAAIGTIATAVPEPSTFVALSVLGMSTTLLVRRRR